MGCGRMHTAAATYERRSVVEESGALLPALLSTVWTKFTSVKHDHTEVITRV